MSGLPDGWVQTTIGALCNLVNGKAFKPTDWSEDGLPIVRIQNLNKPSSKFNYFDGPVEERFLIKEGELLFAWSGTPGTSFGAHIWKGGTAVLNQHIFKVEFDKQLLDKAFFRHSINQTLDEQIAKAHGGVGLRHVTKGTFEETSVPLPPLAEQRRIVAKLDGLLARTARARTDLNRIPTLITNYKKALLVAAFSGELTRQWREATTATEPRAEWQLVQLGNLIAEGPTNGWSPKSDPDATGALSLKLTATTSGYLRLDPDAVKRIHETPRTNSKLWLEPGDLLIQRANTIDYVGAAAIFDGPEKTYIYPDLMMRVRIADPVLRKFVWRFLNSEAARSYFRQNATGTAGNMPKINGQTVRSLPLPLPQPDEQREIVLRIETAFAWLDKVAAEHARIMHFLPKLDQAILAKAFRGNLVPQDRTDEPASVLLERIQAARAEQPKQNRGPRAPREKATMTKSRHDDDLKGKPYLADLLRQMSGPATIEELFKRAELPLTDFYKQLAWEVDAGHIRDDNKQLEAA